MSIPDDEIRETFYNLMLECIYTDPDRSIIDKLTNPSTKKVAIRSLINKTLKTICVNANSKGFQTLRGNWINQQNVSHNFSELFKTLEKLRQLIISKGSDSQINLILNKITSVIEEKDIFKHIVDNLISFYKESCFVNVTIDIIRETFYNIMVEQVISDNLIAKSDIESRSSHIFISLPAYTILACIIYSKDSSGILLYNGTVVNNNNCPDEYKELFKGLLTIKNKMKLLSLTEKHIELIKLYLTNNPDIDIYDDLKMYKTPQIMEIVSMINSIAIQITAMKHFKEIIDDVLVFCLNVL